MKYLKMLGIAAVAAMALMAVVGATTASATTLENNGVALNKAVTIEASLKAGTSAVLKDEFGTTTDTCTGSKVEGTTENRAEPETTRFTGAVVGGNLNTLTFESCTHHTTVIKPGSLHVAWTSGTNGTLTSFGAEVTVVSTFFGATATCKTGAGTKIGTLTGVKEGNATIDIGATINCGILGNSSWTGTYVTTAGANGVIN
jgi:hypothetical protein